MFPKPFQKEYYRQSYPDLKDLSDEELLQHFSRYGEKEGRVASPINNRHSFANVIEQMKLESILEIGPFNAPVVSGPEVFYFDVMTQDELRQRAIEHELDPTSVPAIDFINEFGNLSDIDRKFSAVVSSHCVEHQPDLITHLNQVSDLLSPEGRYFIVIPDKRFCFDHFIPETSVSELVASFVIKQKNHRLDNILRHQLEVTHNDPERHWAGDHGSQTYRISRSDVLAVTKEMLEKSHSTYIDVHAWFFTPNSFVKNMEALVDLGLSDLVVEHVYPTLRNSHEFFAVLKKSESLEYDGDESHGPYGSADQANQERDQANQERDQASRALSEIHASLTWRVTSPVRISLSRLLKFFK